MALRWGARRTVPALLLTALLAAACSIGGGSRDDFSFSEALDLIPASVTHGSDGGVTLAMADLDRAAQLAGVERPANSSDVDAVIAYINALGRGVLMPEAVKYTPIPRVDEFEHEVGWSIVDLSWFVEYRQPRNSVMVAGGDFDEARLTDAMGDRENGVWRLGSAQDGELDPSDRTAARFFGQPIRLALDGGRLIVGERTPIVEDALAGDGGSLADNEVLRNEVLRGLAEAVDAQGAYSALFDARGSHPVDPTSAHDVAVGSDEFVDLQDRVLPQPFAGVAGGVAHEDGAAVAVLAYAHLTAASAEANADALRTIIGEDRSLRGDEPWSSMVTIDDITIDGSIMTARLALGERGYPGLPYNLVEARESLVSHR